MPFYPYARQDRNTVAREPISARLIADLLKAAGADRIVTVDLRTPTRSRVSSTRRSIICAIQNLLTGYIRDNYEHGNAVVVSPDSGRGTHRREVGRRIGWCSPRLHPQDP